MRDAAWITPEQPDWDAADACPACGFVDSHSEDCDLSEVEEPSVGDPHPLPSAREAGGAGTPRVMLFDWGRNGDFY